MIIALNFILLLKAEVDMSKYLCRKRVIEIDNDYKICKDCIKKGFSGYIDLDICLYNNLIKLEDDTSDNN